MKSQLKNKLIVLIKKILKELTHEIFWHPRKNIDPRQNFSDPLSNLRHTDPTLDPRANYFLAFLQNFDNPLLLLSRLSKTLSTPDCLCKVVRRRFGFAYPR